MTDQYVRASGELILENAKNFGTKYAVQKLFYDLDMCGIQTKLFEPQTSIDEIEKTLLEMETKVDGFTVRFSFKDALNLPRGFFREAQKCINFIKRERKDYAIIIQEYVQLVNSFELYFDNDLLYLQVLPGIWEVDTSEAPDIIQAKGNSFTMWRFLQHRQAKLVNSKSSFYIEERKPFSFIQLQEFYEKLALYKNKLEIVKKVFNPLFCHFYEDSKGRFCFINIRNVGRVSINENSPSIFHVIKNSFDIVKWDGHQPILFDVQTEREDENPIITTIRSLQDKEVKTVFINYGILSHPAILLREAGIQVLQSYLLYEKQTTSTQDDELSIEQDKNSVTFINDEQTKIDWVSNDITISGLDLQSLYLIHLNQITDELSSFVGSKAYNLSKVAKGGFLIPRGFVITTNVFDEWLKNQNILVELSTQIFQMYQTLSLQKVAVRSSSMVEDLSIASAAGIYKTSLNITKEMLIGAVEEGFTSLHALNAQFYRSDRSIKNGVGMAIIVQEMINAEISGILFTSNPLNYNSSELLINSTFGLGEPLVSGKASGDTYIIEKGNNKIARSIITQKDIILTENGQVRLVEPIRSSNTLNNLQIAQLVEIGTAIEKMFTVPQDIEFAIKQNKIWVLQSRPITHL